MSVRDILVGCPVAMRAWILPLWFEAVEEAFKRAGRTPAYTFVLDMSDVDTYACIQAHVDMLDRFSFIRHVPEPDLERLKVREWNEDRYHRMVFLRNKLLEGVRRYRPPYFLSLDSDVLLHPDALVGMLEVMEDPTRNAGVVGSKAYLGLGDWLPNYAQHDGLGGLHRQEIDYVAPVQILMAVKLMSPDAYNVDYAWHYQGEDIGWSDACRAKGLNLFFDGRYKSNHVMERPLVPRGEDV